jgi:hypothetical protein
MLLRFFRSTGTQMIIFISLLGIIFWLHPILHIPQVSYFFDSQPMPLYQWVTIIIPAQSFAGSLLTLSLVIIQGFLLVRLNTRFIFINNRTYLPSIFFVMLTASVVSVQRLNPVIFSGFFLLLAFERLFESFRRERLAYEIFSAAFLISVGTLFYPFLIFFMIVVWISLSILRAFNWREWLFTILGFGTPVFLVSGYYYLVHNDGHLVVDMFTNSFTVKHTATTYGLPLISFFVYLLILLIFSSQFMLKSYQSKKILQRKAFTLFFWLFFNVLGLYIFIQQASVELIYLLALPLSFLFAHYFALMRSSFWGSIFLLILLLLIVWNQFN